jgi:hypothetical protein
MWQSHPPTPKVRRLPLHAASGYVLKMSRSTLLRRCSNVLLCLWFVLAGVFGPVLHTCPSDAARGEADRGGAESGGHAHHGVPADDPADGPHRGCDCLSHCGISTGAAPAAQPMALSVSAAAERSAPGTTVSVAPRGRPDYFLPPAIAPPSQLA